MLEHFNSCLPFPYCLARISAVRFYNLHADKENGSQMTQYTSQQLSLMKTFIWVVTAGSFSLAAKQLCTSQPTVSRQLRTLEDHLNVQLLHRTPVGIKLTEPGKRYFEYVQSLVKNLETFESELRGNASLPTGVLRVVVPRGFCEDSLVEIASRYLSAYPSTRLDWKFGDADVRFGDRTIDCAITVGLPKDELLIARKLCDISMSVVAAPALLSRFKKVKTAQDLTKLPWVALSGRQTNNVKLQDQYGDLSSFDITPSFVADSAHAVCRATVSGIGVAVLPECCVAECQAMGELVRVLPHLTMPPVSIYLVYPKSRHYPCKLRKFIDLTLSLSSEVFARPELPILTQTPTHLLNRRASAAIRL